MFLFLGNIDKTDFKYEKSKILRIDIISKLLIIYFEFTTLFNGKTYFIHLSYTRKEEMNSFPLLIRFYEVFY